MNMLIWNIRGIGNDQSQSMLRHLCKSNKVKIAAILEPFVNLIMPFFTGRLGFNAVIGNCNNKIWVFFDDDLEAEVLVDHEQFLHVYFTSPILPSKIFCTFVYAKCTIFERRELWDCLRGLLMSEEPWIVGGDFNVVLADYERKGGGKPKFRAMEDFEEMILDYNLTDAGYDGSDYT